MSIELTPAYMDRPLFLRLAEDYVDTLSKYDSSIKWDEAAWTHKMWNARFIMDERTIQGFVVTEPVLFMIFEDALYIEEIYIVPEARRKGIGVEAVRKVMEKWNKDVFLYILDDNNPAKMFWNAVAVELGWKTINRTEFRQEEGCELRVYQQGV